MSSTHQPRLILASTSKARRTLLSAAGLEFDCETPAANEADIKARLSGSSMAEIAIELARCKAQEVSQRYPEAVVIGADQTLELDGTGFDKPRNGEEAREQLLRLRGRVHNLHSALCCCRSADVVWQHRSMATLAMRRFSEDELTWYIKQAGDKLTQSVGGYQVEGPAIQLFSSIEGDYFTILGLPMLPLLEFLRGQGFLQR